MRVNVVGGGPGGLYASALLKKEYPDWEITVYERDPADNTYGWGVVFSDSTLGNLREADKVSHERITDAFSGWDPIDTYVGGEFYRCGGHSFAGIMRADLLDILQTRCRELGVNLVHNENIEDPESLKAESDLLVGADGLNSTTRETWEDAFEPSVSMGSAKFAWFGTEKPFDVFTFIFRENEHGFWRVHAYPGKKSTFIVECTEETWKNAGMDEKEAAEALAYFEDLFSDHLDGYGLLSKLYAWRNFPVVKCNRWSHENVVLLGDAAHTAHFSIGSGTKLAMEDAIALFDGVREHGTDVSSALNWFEKERRGRVEGLQKAAKRSQRYFENVERYQHLEPRKFAFNMLTRSGRISYESLKVRDPTFTDNYDRWFENTEGRSSAVPTVATPPLFKPLDLRERTIPNRVVLTGEMTDSATNGRPNEDSLDALVEFGNSGAGLVVTEPVAVEKHGRITPGTPGLYALEHGDAWERAVDRIHAGSDAQVGIHLFHAGRRGAMRPRRYGLDRPLPDDDAWPVLAPSARPFTPACQTPKAMDQADLDSVQSSFTESATAADDAGFDHLQLHVGHGYLLSSFLSPLTNDRDDEYGGSLENRMRYPLEVFDAVREVWPDGKPLGVTLQVTDWNLNGFKTTDAVEVAHAFDDHGADLLAVVAGQTTFRERPDFDPTTLADLCDLVRNEVQIPALSTSYVTNYDDVNTMVGSGRADLCTFTPPTLD